MLSLWSFLGNSGSFVVLVDKMFKFSFLKNVSAPHPCHVTLPQVLPTKSISTVVKLLLQNFQGR